jgi:UDP-glucose:(heptosyl)LPS alpha-1,3-glucosyltransferase
VEQWADKQALTQAKIVVANSKLCAKDIQTEHPSVRVEVVYNGVDVARFRPDPQQREKIRQELNAQGPVAVFLGTGFHRKGLDIAIAALPPSWALWVVGEGRPLPGPASVRYLGPAKEPERFLQAADAMILPTRYDPFANACLEAMACGVPVLTTPTNGASEVLPESWMICSTPEEFKEGLLRVNANLGLRCRQIAEGFRREDSFARLLALLVEAAQ